MAELPQPTQDPFLPLTEPEQSPWQGTPEDEDALALVVQDVSQAENWLFSKNWAEQFDLATVMFEAPSQPIYWPGTNHARAHLNVPLIASTIEALTPQIVDGLFGDPVPFSFQPRPGTQPDVARAKSALVAYLLKESRAREEFEFGVRSMLLYGTGIWRYGWESYTDTRRVYRRKGETSKIQTVEGGTIELPTADSDEFECEDIDVEVSRPTFEHIDPRHVFVDPGLGTPDWRKAKFVIHRQYLTARELDELRDFAGYNIPDRDTLRAIFLPPREGTYASPIESMPLVLEREFSPRPRWEPSTVDPLEQPIEVLERWDKERVIVVLNRKVVIRNERHSFGEVPFLSAVFIPLPAGAYGYGLGRLLGGEQRLQASLINARLDEVALNLMGTYVRKPGSSPLPENIVIRPGGVITDENPGDFRALQRLPAVPEAFTEVEASEARAERISGANELTVQGVLPERGRSSITRTATGVTALAGAAGSRIQFIIDRLATQVLVPYVVKVSEMVPQFMAPKVIRQVLDQELQQANTTDLVDLFNARVKFDVWAGSKMAAKRGMAQALPLLGQFLFSGTIPQQLQEVGEEVSAAEFVQLTFDVLGYNDRQGLIRKLSPEERQQRQQGGALSEKMAVIQAQTQAKGQLQQQKLAQQHDNRMQEIQESISGKSIVPALLEKANEQGEDHYFRQNMVDELRSGLPEAADQNFQPNGPAQ